MSLTALKWGLRAPITPRFGGNLEALPRPQDTEPKQQQKTDLKHKESDRPIESRMIIFSLDLRFQIGTSSSLRGFVASCEVLFSFSGDCLRTAAASRPYLGSMAGETRHAPWNGASAPESWVDTEVNPPNIRGHSFLAFAGKI
jgi:hypothetical protein